MGPLWQSGKRGPLVFAPQSLCLNLTPAQLQGLTVQMEPLAPEAKPAWSKHLQAASIYM
jgi:hypothetical protein